MKPNSWAETGIYICPLCPTPIQRTIKGTLLAGMKAHVDVCHPTITEVQHQRLHIVYEVLSKATPQ